MISKVYDLERMLRIELAEIELKEKTFKLDISNYSKTKAEMISLKDKIQAMKEQEFEYEKQFQAARLNVEILNNDNIAHQKTAELYKLEVFALTEDLDLLRRTGGDSQNELQTLKLEYYNFRQENMDAHT